MNKKFLLAVVTVLTAVFVSLSSMTVFAVENEDADVLSNGIIETGNGEGDDNPSGEIPATLQKKAGDVDGNGEIDINDVTVYQLTLVGRMSVTAAFNLNAETVTDNKLNITDATGIQYYVAGNFKKLPVTPDGYYAEIIRP